MAGAATEVGKTWVGVRLLEQWRNEGARVCARKLAQSGEPGGGPSDAELLAAASGEEPPAVCPPTRSYPVAMAPPMAAAALGRPALDLPALLADLSWPAEVVDVGLVETAGGVRSPQGDDADVVDLVDALEPDLVVLVADAGLGAINAVRVSLDALAHRRSDDEGRQAPVRVVLNRFDPTDDLHRRNREWLSTHHGVECDVALEDGELILTAKA